MVEVVGKLERPRWEKPTERRGKAMKPTGQGKSAGNVERWKQRANKKLMPPSIRNEAPYSREDGPFLVRKRAHRRSDSKTRQGRFHCTMLFDLPRHRRTRGLPGPPGAIPEFRATIRSLTFEWISLGMHDCGDGSVRGLSVESLAVPAWLPRIWHVLLHVSSSSQSMAPSQD